MIRRFFCLVFAALTALLIGAPAAMAAGAGNPATMYFSAYDFRYETPYACDNGLTCYAIAKTEGYVSYFNTTGLYRAWLYDSIDGPANHQGFVIQPGQVTSVMCWKASARTGAIWLLTATREPYLGGQPFFVAFIPDADIVLSRVNRETYVPECGYTKT